MLASRGSKQKSEKHFIWSKELTPKQRVFIRKRSIRIISFAFIRYVKVRYKFLIDNWNDIDVISQVPVAWIPRQLLVVVPTDGKRCGFNSMDLIRWMKRNPTNPCSRQEISPEIGWMCIEISQRFIKLEQRRLGIQKRRRNVWKTEQAQLQEMQCVIDRFHQKHCHREKERMKQENFEKKLEQERLHLLSMINTIRSTTVMNRITATITDDRVQSINYQCTVTNMKEKPTQKLITHMKNLLDILLEDDEDNNDSYTSSDTESDLDSDLDSDLETDDLEIDNEYTDTEDIISEEDVSDNDIQLILAMDIEQSS